jgi:transcriptional regulator with XRE-family HTH domain
MTIRANVLLRKARESAGLTQAEAASKSGLSIHEYGDLESDAEEFISGVPLWAAKRVTEVLGCNLEDLIRDEPLNVGHAVPTVPGGSKSEVLKKNAIGSPNVETRTR